MDGTLNALEVFAIAVQIEQNGARYYKRAAEMFDEPEIARIFIELMDWELRHKQLFSEMKKQHSQSSPETEIHEYGPKLLEAKVMAGLAVFGIRPDPADELRGKETLPVVIKKAIENEKDSIVFYNGLKDFAVDDSAKDKIDEIIREELRHIKILNKVWQKTT